MRIRGPYRGVTGGVIGGVIGGVTGGGPRSELNGRAAGFEVQVQVEMASPGTDRGRDPERGLDAPTATPRRRGNR